MKINFSERFKKSYKKLPKEIAKILINKIDIFRNNNKHPSLKIHKLNGRLDIFYSLSINESYRIIYSISDFETYEFIDVGRHDDVYR